MIRSIAIVLALSLGASCFAANSDGLQTIYLVRHAEKIVDGTKDPALTLCGKERAQALAGIFSSIDLSRIYSSDYRRTRETAQPTAIQQRIEIEIYDPAKLADLAIVLRAIKRDVLVVGHSDTTATLAGLLINDESYGSFDEKIYDRIYQVVLSDRAARNHLLHQKFRCSSVLPLPN
jgi:phosphohistidine phosphatase SixA